MLTMKNKNKNRQVDDNCVTKENSSQQGWLDMKNKDTEFYHRKLKQEGSKRWTIPMDKIEHLENCLCIAFDLKEELEKIKKQRIPSYLKLLHARYAIDKANYSTKLLANDGDDTAHKSYKGAV